MRITRKPTNNTLATLKSASRPVVMVLNGRVKPPPVGVVGPLLLLPLLPLLLDPVGAPDIAVGVWLLVDVGVVPGFAVAVA